VPVAVLAREQLDKAWVAGRIGQFAWAEAAACIGTPTEQVFFGDAYTEAWKICARCPVISECRAETDRCEQFTTEVHGFFGGESPRERMRRRRGGR
jgi:Transcription factor WhiB